MNNSWNSNAAKYKICGIHVQYYVLIICAIFTSQSVSGFTNRWIRAEWHWTSALGVYLFELGIIDVLIYGIIAENKWFVLIFLVFSTIGILICSGLLVALLLTKCLFKGPHYVIFDPRNVWYFVIFWNDLYVFCGPPRDVWFFVYVIVIMLLLLMECFFSWVVCRYYRFIGDKKNAIRQNSLRPDSQPQSVLCRV